MRRNFWPTLPSVYPGSVTTQPELVFDATDPEPRKVVIEIKPGYGQQSLDQIVREVVDVAVRSSASRIACVMVGADLGAPMDVAK